MTTTYSIANYHSFDLLCSGYSYISNLPNEGCIDLVKKVAAIALGILLFLPALVLDLVCTAVTCICGYDSKEPELADSSPFPISQSSTGSLPENDETTYKNAFKNFFRFFPKETRFSLYNSTIQNVYFEYFPVTTIFQSTLVYKLMREQVFTPEQKKLLVKDIITGGPIFSKNKMCEIRIPQRLNDVTEEYISASVLIDRRLDDLTEEYTKANVLAVQNIMKELLTTSGDMPPKETYDILTPWSGYPTDDNTLENRAKIIEYSIRNTFRTLPLHMRFFKLSKLQDSPSTVSGWIKAAMLLCKIVNDKTNLVPGFAKLAENEKENCARVLLWGDNQMHTIPTFEVIQSMRKLVDVEILSDEDCDTAQRIGHEIEAELLNNKAIKL